MLEFGLILVFACHLLLVNLAMAGPLGAIWLGWQGDDRARQAGRWLVRWSLWSLTLSMLLGFALLGFEWAHEESRYFDTLRRLPPSRYWFAVSELVFSYVCLLAYLAMRGSSRGSRVMQRVLALLAATNLMYHFPPLLAIVSVISTRWDLAGLEIDRAAYRRLMLDGEVLARVIHVWLASAATLGIAIMAYASRLRMNQQNAEQAAMLIGRGALVALVSTLLQLPVGLWVFWQLPTAASESLLGADRMATGLFAASLIISLRLMHVLAAVVLGDTQSRAVVESVVSMIVIIVLMTGTLHRIEGHRAMMPARIAEPLVGRIGNPSHMSTDCRTVLLNEGISL